MNHIQIIHIFSYDRSAIEKSSTHLYEARAGVFEFLQTVVVSSVHDAQQGPGLEGDAAGVDVLNELSEDVRLELLDNHGLVFFHATLEEEC